MSEGAQFTKVHGGIISGQMLKGNLRFFSMRCSGLFTNTISDGNVYILGDMPKFGGSSDKVPAGKPVPRSAAELALQYISTRCSICQIILVSDDEIQFVTENNSFSWSDPHGILDDVKYMEANVKLLGGKYVPNTTDGGGTLVNFNVPGFTMTEFLKFKLA